MEHIPGLVQYAPAQLSLVKEMKRMESLSCEAYPISISRLLYKAMFTSSQEKGIKESRALHFSVFESGEQCAIYLTKISPGQEI